jgi:hypothetical protein
MPNSVQTAVRLMYVGAALSVIELIVGLVTIGSVKTAIKKAYPHYTVSQVHSLEVASIVIGVLVGLISVGLWLWMARANAAGRNYARITSTAFFGLSTLFLLLSLRSPHAGLGLVFNVLVWLAGLGAVIMLWRTESAPWFSQPRQ